MLKEVGASGQISLGKKYAGQLFDLQTRADGAIVLQPMQVVPAPLAVQEEGASYASEPPNAWAAQHATDIDQYNAWAEQREPYAQRLRRWSPKQKT